MCKKCGSNISALRNLEITGNKTTVQNLFDSGNYKLVRYSGRDFTTTIGSPTGVIVKDGLKSYGRGKSGDYLLVHTVDITKSPTTFTLLAKGSTAYGEALVKYGLTEEETPVNSIADKAAISDAEKTVKEAEQASNGQNDNVAPVNTPDTIQASVKKTTIAQEKVADVKPDLNGEDGEPAKNPVNDNVSADRAEVEGQLLSKANALPLTEFRDRYGFSHHMQVLGKIKSGELKSYKNGSGETLVYHFD